VGGPGRGGVEAGRPQALAPGGHDEAPPSGFGCCLFPRRRQSRRIIYPLVQAKKQVAIGQEKNGIEADFQQQVLWRIAESF